MSHMEVDLILVNGRSVEFGNRVQDGDRISVDLIFEEFDIVCSAGSRNSVPPVTTCSAKSCT